MNQKYGIHNIEQVSRYCYYAGLGLGFFVLAGILLIIVLHISVPQIIPACPFYEATGYYCPGCGGTRAVMALFHGKIAASLYYHPFVIYMIVYYAAYEISHLMHSVTHGKIRGFYFCPLFYYIGIILIIIQWVVKNYLKLRYGFLL